MENLIQVSPDVCAGILYGPTTRDLPAASRSGELKFPITSFLKISGISNTSSAILSILSIRDNRDQKSSIMKSSKKNACKFFMLLTMLIVLMGLTSYRANAQSMGISNSFITPDASSILEMRTITKGLLIPRMATTDRNAISSPATGLMIYNTTTNQFNYYNGSSWIVMFSGSVGVNSITGTANRVTIGGTSADPTIDIASTYIGQSSITTLGTISTGTWNSTAIGIGYGGTGQTTQQAAINALTGTQTSGTYLRSNGTNASLSAIQAADVPTLNQNTTGSAATLTTSRNIHGGSFNGSADVTNIIASTYGGTGNGFAKLSGPATSEKTFTLPNASATILTDNAAVTVAQGGTGVGTLASNGVLYGNGTSAVQALPVNSTATVQYLSQVSSGAPTWVTPTLGTVTSVSGTANRISVATGTTTPVIDIASTYVGQSSITTLGTIGSGTWNGSLVTGTYGGTGVNNGSSTITLGGNLVTSGAFATTLTSTATTNATLPAGTNTLYSTKSASITSAQLLTSLSDPTGTGVAVFGTTPTLATPVINGLATGTGVASAATASTLVTRDANANINVNNTLDGYATTATAAGATTLTVGSAYLQYFTGSTTQTVTLPVASTLVLGHQFFIVNNSTGIVTIQSSGANTIQAMAANSYMWITCILTSGTGTASWSASYVPAAVSTNTANTVVLRDASGNFSAGTITATFSGSITGTASKATNLVGGNATTLLGSVPYQSNTDVTTMLSPNTTTTKKFLTQTGDGTNGAAPGWNTIVAGDIPTLNQNTTGSAATLTTSRNIYGNAFNGSADVTGIIASTYGGTGNGFAKLSGPATSEKIFTLPNASATILTDNAAVTATQGGTGNASYTIGDILYASASTTLSKLADVATGNVLISGGTSTAPSWGKVGLTTHVSGTLPIANGGTNSTATPTNGGVAYGDGSAYQFNAAGVSGQVLQSNGAAAPDWTDAGTMMLGGNSNNTAVNNTTQYFMIIGAGVGAVADVQAGTRSLFSRAGTIKNLYVIISAALGGGKTGTVTVMKNGVATSLVATLSVGPTSFSDLTHTVSVAAGDEIGIKVTTTGNVKFSYAADFTY